EKWEEVAKRLTKALERLTLARATYSLPPEENARLLKLLSGGKTDDAKNEKAGPAKGEVKSEKDAPPAASKKP
ncbi:MAG TPA: hypothetical protein VGP68_22010, partial [Gemmataceae bacterium]|nr:hypothetical protein [Gemmataceae bacterium]